MRLWLARIAWCVGLGISIATLTATAQEGDWPIPGKDLAGLRYSELDQINTANVGQLTAAWTFSLGVLRGQEAAPIVAGNTMFVVTPYPNILYALDLTEPGAPLKWKHEPKPVAAAQGIACCDTVNRGAAYADGRVFYNTLDGQTIALDSGTGERLWRTQLGDINIGETITMAPLVVRDRVLVGNSGGEYGVRGWIAALDADDGSLVWRAYSPGPDKDVLIGERFRPFYPQDQGQDLGVETWPPDAWRIGGGTVWGWLTYDPEADLLYHGTANPGPWNPDQRPGDNKWTAGIFARDPGSGEAIWFYQWSPHDLHDYDGINESILVDLEWQGRPRKALVHPERNGYVYLMDRLTGEVLYAEPFAAITTSTGVDLETGRLIYNPEKAGQNFHFEAEPDMTETVARVIRENARPVLVTSAGEPSGDKVLVCYDGSAQSSRAMHMFVLLGLAQDREVHLVSVAQTKEAADARLRSAEKLFAAHDIPVQLHGTASDGDAAEIILAEVDALGPALLVMGAFGHTGLRELFLGSATRTLLRQCQTPMLIHH